MLYKFMRSFALLVAAAAQAKSVSAQDASSLTLPRALSLARAASADVIAARYAVDAAQARARQAGAFTNPVLAYSREQTGRAGESTSQDIIGVDQMLEAPGIRSARRDAARLRSSVAEARLRGAEAQLDLDVAHAYGRVIAADQRASLAQQAAGAFAAAARISERRLREGDISGFAARRIRLETARYAVLRAEALLARNTARVALATLTASPIDTSTRLREPAANFTLAPMSMTDDSLVALALRSRPELMAGALEVDVATAETRLASRERLPWATLSLGSKREEVIGGDQLSGFAAGLSVPLPLWDRRGGAVGAAEAETRRRAAELAGVRRRVTREVTEGVEALRAVQEQLRVLGPDLQSDATSVLRSAQLAYAEGELSLIEWLDTVRAYYETQTSIVNLRAELLVRAAALERAVGTSLFQELR